MVPTRLNPQIGGAVSFDVGFWSHGIVTDYTPTKRFAYAEPWPTHGPHADGGERRVVAHADRDRVPRRGGLRRQLRDPGRHERLRERSGLGK